MFWLVVSTHLKNISQNGNVLQVGAKVKNIWNHHLVLFFSVVILDDLSSAVTFPVCFVCFCRWPEHLKRQSCRKNDSCHIFSGTLMHIHEIGESFTKLSYLQRSTIVHRVDERTPAPIEICKTWVKL